MKSEQERSTGKIRYEKPTAVDLGPAAPIVGASCVDGNFISGGVCQNIGNGAAVHCWNAGNSAGICDMVGNSAGA